MRICFLFLILCLIAARRLEAAPFLRPDERVLFLGDSITMDGRYIGVLEYLMRTRLPDTPVELLNLGLASETISGLSEKHHPWPRPNVHERAQRALERTKPSVVVFCYGMNDGIYAPFADERFQAYQKGVQELAAKCRAAQARVVILTPPPFDAPSFSGQLQPAGAEDYGYQKPFAEYDAVLKRYGQWLLTTQGLADKVIDLHAPVAAAVAAWRQSDPQWKSGDGVHPVAALHWIIGGVMAEEFGIPGTISAPAAGAPDDQARCTIKFKSVPPLLREPTIPRGFLEAAGFPRRMNSMEVMIPNLTCAAWHLIEGERLLAVVTRDHLARGLDLTQFPALRLNRDSQLALPLVMERQKVLAGSWREHVGHTRPDTDRKVKPLDEAHVRALDIDGELEKLLRSRDVTLTLEPVAP